MVKFGWHEGQLVGICWVDMDFGAVIAGDQIFGDSVHELSLIGCRELDGCGARLDAVICAGITVVTGVLVIFSCERE